MNSVNARNIIRRTVGRYLTSSMARPKETLDPIQENALTETCFLVDKNDKVIGTASKRDCHRVRPDGTIPLHRAFSVFLFNKKGHLLLQKRANTKIRYPDHYSSSCSGHPLADIPMEGEEKDTLGVKHAARRRLHYELGIKPEQIAVNDIFYMTRIYHCDTGNGVWGDHAIVYVLIVHQNFNLEANSNEISELSFIPRGGLSEHLSELQAPLEPVFELVYKTNLLHLWWKNLEDLNSVKNYKNIIPLDKCKDDN